MTATEVPRAGDADLRLTVRCRGVEAIASRTEDRRDPRSAAAGIAAAALVPTPVPAPGVLDVVGLAGLARRRRRD
ncbi:MAG: hypothetical protein GY911_00505 [Actinomycetales bacterium]|nr:hypothetical protein [Actinomycetales bacterium]